MLARRIIPCLDVRDGQVVKGVKFKEHVVLGGILELARRYRDAGADELVFYDIMASVEARSVDVAWIEAIARDLDIPFCVAGGIRSVEDARRVLNAGADKISVNTPAHEDPALIERLAEAFGSQCVVVGVDSKRDEGGDWVCWRSTGSEAAARPAKRRTLDWVGEVVERGAGEIVLNTMDQDGMREGYDLEQLQAVRALCPVPLIASGGAGKREHFAQVFEVTGVEGALAAGVFHRGEIAIGELKTYLADRGLRVRT